LLPALIDTEWPETMSAWRSVVYRAFMLFILRRKRINMKYKALHFGERIIPAGQPEMLLLLIKTAKIWQMKLL